MTITSAATPASSLPGPTPGVLTAAVLRGFADSFSADAAAVRMQNAVTRSGLDEVAVNHARQMALSTTMSHRLDDWSVANQKKSGRCWLFAALNLFR